MIHVKSSHAPLPRHVFRGSVLQYIGSEQGPGLLREVELRARSGRKFEVLEVRAPADAGLSARAKDANRYTVEQRAVSAGHHRGAVTFVLRVEGSQQPVEVPVRVVYQATAPTVAASAAAPTLEAAP